MKRLLLGPVLVLPLLTLGFCKLHIPELPKLPAGYVREIPLDTFEQRFPPITTMPTPAPHKAPAVKHRPNQVKPHASVGRPVRPPLPHSRPPVDQAPVEAIPPQQGPICIFPLNMIPNCTPQEVQ